MSQQVMKPLGSKQSQKLERTPFPRIE